MKKVLWISRHAMSPAQLADLERGAGDVIVVRQYADTVNNAEDLRPLIEDSDIIAAVLPVEMLAAVKAMVGSRTLIAAVSARVRCGTHITPDGKEEAEFRFEHKYWQQYLELKLETAKF